MVSTEMYESVFLIRTSKSKTNSEGFHSLIKSYLTWNGGVGWGVENILLSHISNTSCKSMPKYSGKNAHEKKK